MLVIVGPSACGKTQIVNHLIANYGYEKLVTYTTRPMRVNEVNHIDYHFISKEDFQTKIDNQFFLEYVCYNQNYYGTSFSELSDNKVVIIEAEGLKKYIEKARDHITIIFIKCPKPIRRIRMIERLDLLENINKRLKSDDEIFNMDIQNLADYVIDSSNSNVYACAKEVDRLYKKAKKK